MIYMSGDTANNGHSSTSHFGSLFGVYSIEYNCSITMRFDDIVKTIYELDPTVFKGF
jgi:hypothetical protein